MDEDAAGRDFAAGYDAFARDDYAAAHAAWEPLAAAGMAKAQFYLGYLHQCGHGTAQDYHRARDYYRMAAEQGDAGAQYALGNLFYFGQGTAKDRAEAAKWFGMAAVQGHRDAQDNLDDIRADGTAKDDAGRDTGPGTGHDTKSDA